MALSEPHSFLSILNESIKLIPKNGKLIALIAILWIALSSTSLLLFTYAKESLMADMFVTEQQSFMPDLTSKTTSTPPQIISHLGQDSALLIALQMAFCISFATILFFSAVSTVILSSISYTTTKNLSLKELFFKIGTRWTRPLITTLYASCLTFGYFVFVVTMLAPLVVLKYPNPAALFPAIFLGIVAFIFYTYLFVAWALAIVVSVVEESCYGIQALAKATTLVEGKRLYGFLLIICSNFVAFIIVQGYNMIIGNKGFVNPTINLLVSVTVSVLAKMFLVVAYTVLYFECKKEHGEEIELCGSLEYTEVPTHDKVVNDMP